jgi:hypothetical protein
MSAGLDGTRSAKYTLAAVKRLQRVIQQIVEAWGLAIQEPKGHRHYSAEVGWRESAMNSQAPISSRARGPVIT